MSCFFHVILIFSFPRPSFPKQKPRLFFRDQIFRDQNRDFFSETKFSETEIETRFSETGFALKKLAKVSKPRSFETEMSMFDHQYNTYSLGGGGCVELICVRICSYDHPKQVFDGEYIQFAMQ